VPGTNKKTASATWLTKPQPIKRDWRLLAG